MKRRTIGKLILIGVIIILIAPILYSTFVIKERQKLEIERFYGNFEVEKNNNLTMLGVLYIPRIYLSLPIYKGTSDEAISVGAGVMDSTMDMSGNIGTRPVITSHSGIPTRNLFIDLEDMELEDEYYIETQEGIKKYIVDEIETILPSEIEKIQPKENKALSTLLTCDSITGINSHRLLVTGELVDFDGPIDYSKYNNFYTGKYQIYAISLSSFILTFLVIGEFKERKKRRTKHEQI